MDPYKPKITYTFSGCSAHVAAVCLAAGLLFGFLDYDGGSASDSMSVTLGVFSVEGVQRWTMAAYWLYFAFEAASAWRTITESLGRLLLFLLTATALYWMVSASRLYVHTGQLASFGVYEYRNLSLFVLVAFAVAGNGSFERMKWFALGWAAMAACRAGITTVGFALGARSFQGDLKISYTTFDGTRLSQEHFCAILMLGFYFAGRPLKWQLKRVLIFLAMLLLVVDVLGSFRRHVYLRILASLVAAMLMRTTRGRVVKASHALVVLAVMGVVVLAFFGKEMVVARAASLRVNDFDNQLDMSNYFYLESWSEMWAVLRHDFAWVSGVGLRDVSLYLPVGDITIPFHTGFWVVCASDGLLGLAVLVGFFLIVPVVAVTKKFQCSDRRELVVIGLMVGYIAFEGLFPFKDAVVGNIKTCVAIGIAVGLIARMARIDELRMRQHDKIV